MLSKSYLWYSLRFSNLLGSEVSKEMSRLKCTGFIPPSPQALRQRFLDVNQQFLEEGKDVDMLELGHVRVAVALIEYYERLCTVLPHGKALYVVEDGGIMPIINIHLFLLII